MLEAYSKDLIALGSNQLDQLKTIFPDRLYVAFQNPSVANHLSELARKLELPTVVTHPVYYLSPEQARLQKTLTAIRLNQPLKDVPSSAMAPADAYFMSAQEVESRFQDFPRSTGSHRRNCRAVPI